MLLGILLKHEALVLQYPEGYLEAMASKEKKDKVKKQPVKQEPTKQSNGNQKRPIDDGMAAGSHLPGSVSCER